MFLVLRGGSENSNFSQFQIFPKLGTRGGRQISNLSQIQKRPNHPRGGGASRKLWTFSTFWAFFFFECFLSITTLGYTLSTSPLGPFFSWLPSVYCNGSCSCCYFKRLIACFCGPLQDMRCLFLGPNTLDYCLFY